MKIKIKHLTLLFSLAVLGSSHSAWALTQAGTSIDNLATISYDVGGVTQDDIGSSESGNTAGAGTATTFLVDRVVDLNVTKGSDSEVTPGTTTTQQTITYTLDNEGNDTETFNITFGQEAGDDFDTSSCSVTAAGGSVSFTGTTIELNKETTANVTVTCTIPSASTLAPANDKESLLEFIATAARAEDNGSADDKSTVQTVYGDANANTTSDQAAKNGVHAAVNTYRINTAVLSVTKTSTVVCDVHNGTTNPKRIPGAIVKYEIAVNNGVGAATASNVVIADPLDAFPTQMQYTDTAPATGGCSTATVAAAAVSTSGTGTITGAGIATADDTEVRSTAMSMDADSTATLTFYATIQ